MPITTRIAPMYAFRLILFSVVFFGLGVWGVIDLIKIRQMHEKVAQSQQLEQERRGIEERQTQPGGLSETDKAAYIRAGEELEKLKPGGAELVPPAAFDEIMQWLYITCLPCGLYTLWLYFKARKQTYTLDQAGTLSFAHDKEHGSGAWPRAEIADIDMSRWMAKSIAHAVHAGDNARLKLDAYIHKDLHLIIGSLANRFYPDKWEADGKMVKPPLPPEDTSGSESVPESQSPTLAANEDISPPVHETERV